jgi:hypothetical protein
MRRLSEVDGGFRICYTGTTLMLVGLAILAPGLLVLTAEFAGFPPLGAPGGLILALLLIGGAWIGNVLTFAVGAFKLYRRHQNPLYMAAGILFAADAALLLLNLSGMLTLAGYALMYTALNPLKEKKRAIPPATSPRHLQARQSA